MQAVRFVGVGRQPAIGTRTRGRRKRHHAQELNGHVAEPTDAPLTEAVAVYEKLAAGKIAGRAVLVPGGA